MEAGSVAALIAAVGIWFGIAAMIAVNGYRGRQQAAALQQQRVADDQRHAEAMTALNELIQAGQRQGNALEALIETGQRQGAALEELLRRER